MSLERSVEEAVLALYRRRCVGFYPGCTYVAVCLHHALPRSVAPQYAKDYRNLIPLCDACHRRVHTVGALRHALKLVRRRRRLQHLLGITEAELRRLLEERDDQEGPQDGSSG